RLSHTDAGDARRRAALPVRRDALAADLPGDLRRLRRRRRRERHHRQRPLAALLPDRRCAVGADGGDAGLSTRTGRAGLRRAAAVTGANPRLILRALAEKGPSAYSFAQLAERSAARLAHQSGGLGVASSNLAAPTSSLFLQLSQPYFGCSLGFPPGVPGA